MVQKHFQNEPCRLATREWNCTSCDGRKGEGIERSNVWVLFVFMEQVRVGNILDQGCKPNPTDLLGLGCKGSTPGNQEYLRIEREVS